MNSATGAGGGKKGLGEQVLAGALAIAVRAPPLEDVRTVRTVGAPAVAAPELVNGLPMVRSRPVGGEFVGIRHRSIFGSREPGVPRDVVAMA